MVVDCTIVRNGTSTSVGDGCLVIIYYITALVVGQCTVVGYVAMDSDGARISNGTSIEHCSKIRTICTTRSLEDNGSTCVIGDRAIISDAKGAVPVIPKDL